MEQLSCPTESLGSRSSPTNMPVISCTQAADLIAEAQGASCKSPRERILLEIGLLWEASILGGTADITADNTVITADSTIITADMTEFL